MVGLLPWHYPKVLCLAEILTSYTSVCEEGQDDHKCASIQPDEASMTRTGILKSKLGTQSYLSEFDKSSQMEAAGIWKQDRIIVGRLSHMSEL